MKKLWIAFIVLASLGSLYPFNFQASELNAAVISEFLQSCCRMLGRGDILGNIILFVPIGFTGMLGARSAQSAGRRLAYVCMVGGSVALALQLMQIFLPSRDENLQDVAWNLLGVGSGAALAHLASAFILPTKSTRADASLVPLTLVGTWLIYRLIPFVPSIDLQLIKDSLRPLLSQPLDPVSVIHDATAWVVVAYLLRQAQRHTQLDTYLPILMITVFGLEILIIDNTLDLSNVVGALLALAIWWAAARYPGRQEGAVLLLLLGTLIVTGIAPFETRTDIVSIEWFPFHGFLHGSMYLNTQAAAEKIFLYGGLVYLLWRTRINVASSVFAAFLVVLALEFAQTYLVGHTPEITDPLLVLLASAALWAVEKYPAEAALSEHVDDSNSVRTSMTTVVPHRGSRRRQRSWVKRSVNLKAHQFDLLLGLSREMGISVSRVTRRIIEQFIDELEHDIGCESDRRMSTPASPSSGERWVSLSVNLRRQQIQFLDSLATEMQISISSAIRQIVAHFISKLGSDESARSMSVDQEPAPVKINPTPED